jgi:hypothetical protein
MESSGIPTYKSTHLQMPYVLQIIQKHTLEKKKKKTVSSTNGSGETECQHVLFCTKPKFKWINDLNIKPDTLNPIEKKVGNRLEHTGTGKSF